MHNLRPGVDLILASGSPRRRELLSEAGIPFKLEVSPIDEQPLDGESPQLMVKRLALAKALAVAQRFPNSWVLGADTTVSLRGSILGKPESDADALRMLSLLQGTQHEVWSAFALVRGATNVRHVESACTEVEMRALDRLALERYVATGEPGDKAGAYAIQGRGAHLISQIKGSYSNVVGLDIAAVAVALRRFGLVD